MPCGFVRSWRVVHSGASPSRRPVHAAADAVHATRANVTATGIFRGIHSPIVDSIFCASPRLETMPIISDKRENPSARR